jgi:hypothetical protein
MKISDIFDLFENKFSDNKKNTQVLERFIRGNWNSSSEKQSKKNLENNLLEITYKSNHHKGNALLITNNGYFLTALHCLEKDNNEIIKTQTGKRFYNYKICKSNKKEDLVLGKINLSRDFTEKKFNLYNTNKLEKIPFQLTTIRKGEVKRKYGFIQNNWNNHTIEYQNHLSMNGIGKPGDSGGILIGPKGKLIGIMSGGNNYIIGTGIKMNSALNLIYAHIRDLNQKNYKH